MKISRYNVFKLIPITLIKTFTLSYITTKSYKPLKISSPVISMATQRFYPRKIAKIFFIEFMSNVTDWFSKIDRKNSI